MATEQYTTLGQTTLSGSYTSGGTSLSFTSAVSFPASGNFRVRVDDELFKCTAVSGTTITVVGAQEGTSAANHASGADVTEVLTAMALDAIRADMVQSGTTSSLPTADRAGNLYLPTDGYFISRDTGAAQERWGPISKVGFQPYSGLTWVQQGSGLGNDDGGMLTLYDQTYTASGMHILKKAATTVGPGFIFTAHCLITSAKQDYHRIGILMRESSTGKLHTFSTNANGGAGGWRVERWTDENNLISAVYDTNDAFMNVMFSYGVWFRLEYDGTNVIAKLSGDGKVWATLSSTAKTTAFTAAPDEIGIFVSAFNTVGWPVGISVINWLES